MDKKKRGRPFKDKSYDSKFFLNYVCDKMRTASEIRRLIFEDKGVYVSWNTVNNHLNKLWIQGLIDCMVSSHFLFYYKKT